MCVGGQHRKHCIVDPFGDQNVIVLVWIILSQGQIQCENSLTSSSFGGTWLHVRCSRKAVPELELKKQRLIRQADTFHLTFTAIFLRLLMLNAERWALSRLSCAVCAPVKTNRGELLNLRSTGRSGQWACRRKCLSANQRWAPQRAFRKKGGPPAAGEPGTPAARWGTSRARPLGNCFRVGIAQLYRPFVRAGMHAVKSPNQWGEYLCACFSAELFAWLRLLGRSAAGHQHDHGQDRGQRQETSQRWRSQGDTGVLRFYLRVPKWSNWYVYYSISATIYAWFTPFASTSMSQLERFKIL